jgi:hypothetical protein
LGSFGGFRDGHIKQNTPTAPHKMTGRKNRQLRSIVTSLAVHVARPDEPLPITRECEKNIKATISAKAEMQTSNNPIRRRIKMFINVVPPNVQSSGTRDQPA